MEITKLVEAKNKAKKVIISCDNLVQLSGAEKYVQLFYERFDSSLDRYELDSLLSDRRKILFRNFNGFR